MNIKQIMLIGKIVTFGSIISIPLLWISAKSFDFLHFQMFGFTVYSWFYIISWYSVVFVMVIRPLADILPKIKILRQLCFLRRAFGILSAGIIVTILLDTWITDPGIFKALLKLKSWEGGYPLAARLSEISALILLGTSNSFSQKGLKKNWKRIQRLSYIYFITGGILAMRYGDDYFVALSMSLVIIIFFITLLKKFFQTS